MSEPLLVSDNSTSSSSNDTEKVKTEGKDSQCGGPVKNLMGSGTDTDDNRGGNDDGENAIMPVLKEVGQAKEKAYLEGRLQQLEREGLKRMLLS